MTGTTLKSPEVPTGIEINIPFAWIPPGRFQMGSDKADNEKPVHRVTISKGFWMGVAPITQAQFEGVMGYNPSHFRGPDRPVEMVNWFYCQEFCTKLTELTGKPIRLPTEAEWEYACRAGSSTEYWNGNGEEALKKVAWYGNAQGPSKGETQPVGRLEKNPWGLHDVHGNVGEWCLDCYEAYTAEDKIDPNRQSKEDLRILRGGAWGYNPSDCRAAKRNWASPASRLNFCGFRVAFRMD